MDQKNNSSMQSLSDKQLQQRINEQRKRTQEAAASDSPSVSEEWQTLCALLSEQDTRDKEKRTSSSSKRFVAYLKKHKIATVIVALILLIVIGDIKDSVVRSVSDFINRDRPQVYQLEGMKISEAEKLLNDNGIIYDFDGDIFDENAKNEQTVTYISQLYSKGKTIYSVDKDRLLLEGDKVTIYTDYVTKAQQEQVNACKAKGSDYEHKFVRGEVSCTMTIMAQLREEKRVCEENGKVWYSDSIKCITQKEADERRAKEAEEARNTQTSQADNSLQQEEQPANDNITTSSANQTQQEDVNNNADASTNTQDSPYEIPANEVTTGIAACERALKDAGYPSPKISMTRGYWSGYDYEWMIVGTATYKEGLTSYRKTIGQVVCRYNWKSYTGIITNGI